MADVNMKDIGGITKYGGGVLRLSDCSDAGVLTGADFIDLGYIEVTEFFDDRDEEKVYDETGNIVQRKYGNRDVGMTATLMQSNAAILDFLIAAEDKYYTLYYKASKTGDMNGKTQELFVAIAKIKPAFRVQSGQKKVPISITFLPNETQVTISTPQTLFESIAATTITIAAGAYYDIVEN